MKKRLLLLALLLTLLPAAALAGETATSAKACVVMDAASGRLLLEHNAYAPLPMASTTKIMTALLALENGQLDEPVTCTRNAFGVPGTSIYLDLGETLTLEEMLYGLLLASGNDAAVAIAEHIGGTVENFCSQMTERAASLGCTNTVFQTPHGLPKEGHYTTARDLALITREAMRYTKFREIVSTQRATIPWQNRSYDRVLRNKNRLLRTYPGAMGVKTGFTRAAGRCLVSAARRDGMTLICVVFGCPDWFDESERLLDLGFEGWEAFTVLHEGETVRMLPVLAGDRTEIPAVLADDLTAVLPKGKLPNLTIELPESLKSPVFAGEKLGIASLALAGETLTESDVVAGKTVARNDFSAHLKRLMSAWMIDAQ